MPGETFNPSFNAGGDLGLPALTPLSDARLSSVSVETKRGGLRPVREEYRFAALSGAGTLNFGLAPEDIVWDLVFVVASAANRTAFEGELRQLIAASLRSELRTESGDVFPYVELVNFTVAPPQRLSNANGWCVEMQILFRNMQPAGE